MHSHTNFIIWVLPQFVISQPRSLLYNPPRLSSIHLINNYQELLFYYFHKTAAQHERNGNFVDIHDGIPVGKEEYDVLITNICQEELSRDISDIFGVPYLSEAGDPQAF